MLLLIAFATGVASAFAFQPVGWWPLMPLALAVLCELVARAGSLRRALLIGWLFGLGQFVHCVRRAVNTPDALGQCTLWQGGMEPNIPVGSAAGVEASMKRAPLARARSSACMVPTEPTRSVSMGSWR